MKYAISGLIALSLLSLYGRSEAADATRCANLLQPHARLVFDAVIAQPQPELTLREVMRARVILNPAVGQRDVTLN